MSELDRGSRPRAHQGRSGSGSQHSPSNSRSYLLAPDVFRQGEQEGNGSHAVRYRRESAAEEDYLTPLVSSSRRNRGRVDSLSSIGSSVAPAVLPKVQTRAQMSSRHMHRDGMSPSTSTTTSAGGGLEAWLQSQSVNLPGGPSTAEPFPSFAPSGRVRKMNAVDEAELGSDAGRSVGARSAGPRINGTGSGRSKKDGQRRMAIPEWESAGLDADAAGLSSDPQKLETVLRWRRDSTAKAKARTRGEMSEIDGQIAPETRRRTRDVGAGSFSAGGLSVLREGVRRPRQTFAEPSLDALLSAPSSEQAHARLPSSRSFSGTPSIRESVLSSKAAEGKAAEGKASEDPSASPLRSFVRWFLLDGSKSNLEGGMTLVYLTVVLASILCKWTVGLGSWSGKGAGPMHGDLEAQRHWIEMTLHLPRSQWYFYDLDYWGLDYPPLTAIVSRWCGQVARLFPALAPSLALDSSRGDESPMLIVFMRATVLALDLAIYTPAVLLFLAKRLQGRGRRTRAIAAMSILLQPSLILIDHGHFQYNTVMLGLSVAAFSLLYTSLPNPDLSSNTSAKESADMQARMTSLSRRISYEYITAAVCFSLSLCFKQMALYFAPAVFAVMLGRCWGLANLGFERGLICFFGIGLATTLTFAAMFQPWLTDLARLGQVLHRIFPLARGIFEDKVSNVWCFLSVLPIPSQYKLRNVVSIPALAKLSLATTLLVILLPCVQLFAAAAETVRLEMFLYDDAKRQLAASERRRIEGSVAGSSKARHRKRSQAAPSEAGSDLASILSGGRGTSTVRGQEARSCGLPEKRVATASSSPSPAASVLPYALLSTSLAFFLFGFQTHEKSILLPLLPVTLLISTKGDEWGAGAGKTDWEWAVLTNNLAVFSMWPLLQRDGLALQYATLVLLWNWSIGYRPFDGLWSSRQTFVAWFATLAHVTMIALHVLELAFPLLGNLTSPLTARYPDLFAVLNVLLCTPCLALVWVWSTKRQLEVGFASGVDILSLQGSGSARTRATAK